MSQLTDLLSRIEHYLPDQGPLEYFVHHNTLHAFEKYDFFDAVKKGADLYGTRAFMPLSVYKKHYFSGRISPDVLNQSILKFIDKHQLDLQSELVLDLLLTSPNSSVEVPDILQSLQLKSARRKPSFYKEWIQSRYDVDIDTVMAPLVFDFLAAYYDFGLAQWTMPNRESGAWQCFLDMYSVGSLIQCSFEKQLQAILKFLISQSAEESILILLQKLSVEPENYETYLFNLSYRYKGWAATITSLEKNPDWNRKPEICPSFLEFVAILLVTEYAVVQSYANEELPTFPYYGDIPKHNDDFLNIFQQTLIKHPSSYQKLIDCFLVFTDKNCEEIWHIAYENSLYNRFVHSYKHGLDYVEQTSDQTTYQVLCCIDDREESFRRYLEQDSHCETFGVAGHFNLSILYKSLLSKRHRALSPAVVKPNKRVEEVPVNTHPNYNLISFVGWIQHLIFRFSKQLFGGFVLSLFYGYVSIVPFLIGVFFPTKKAKIDAYIRKKLYGDFKTQLKYKIEENPDGFTLKERISIAESLLKNSGLIKTDADYVFIIGHGSSSLNNPHAAAYDCGACGGGRGDANARVCAKILNEPEVRDVLNKQGFHIPKQTVFIRGYHNTSNGTVTFFNLPQQTPALASILSKIQYASLLDAKERCRRFEEVDLTKPESYFQDYVQGRAFNLGQPRPEYGHATNSLCVVGPRQLSKPLYLDRRAFLVSYDPKQDINGESLNAILQAVGPVCAGINLEYYFSFIDNEVYGCGTKLPHNVTSLLGVMNGHMSDLQLGLAKQMIEIHEPVRLFMCVYCSFKQLKKLLEEQGAFQLLVKNRWIALMVHDSDTDTLYRYEDSNFQEINNTQNFLPPIYHFDDPKFFVNRDHIPFGILRR